MPFSWISKAPDEEYEYEHDWAKRLLVNDIDVGDTIVPSSAPDPDKHPKALIIEGDAIVDALVVVPASAKIQYRMIGGTMKTQILISIWTAQNRHYEERIILPIKPR